MNRIGKIFNEGLLYTIIVIDIALICLGLIAMHTTALAIASTNISETLKKPITEEVTPLTKKHVITKMVFKAKTQRELINGYVEEIASNYKLDPFLIKSIIHQESRYNPNARNGNHLGLMQVSKRWHSSRASKLGVTDFHDPYSNILLGADYLSELFKKYKDPRLVLMIYNMGTKTAFKMYKEGKISSYAKTVLKRADEYRKGE